MQPEARLQRRIVEAFQRHGWLAYRLRPAGLAGWPDLYALVAGRPLHLEVKRPGRKPTKLQRLRLAELADHGAVVGIVTSVDEAVDLARQVVRANVECAGFTCEVAEAARFVEDPARFEGETARFVGDPARFAGETARFDRDPARFPEDPARFVKRSARSAKQIPEADRGPR